MSKTTSSKKPPIFIIRLIKYLQNLIENIRQELAPPFVHVLEMAAGGMKSQLIYLAAELSIPDRLKDGKKSISELALELQCNEEALYRFMRALAPFKIIKEVSPKVYQTTKYGRTLEKNNSKSLYPLALLTGEKFWRAPLENLKHTIKTGETSFDYVYNESYFDWLKNNPEKFSLFNRWMDSSSNMNCPVIASSYPFSNFKSIVDIGGGYGALLSHILHQHTSLTGILFDLPEVVSNARSIDEIISNRCKIIGGDFMTEVPKGADLYIMQQIIHDWSDEVSIKILKNCRKAMNSNGRVLIVDTVIKDGNSFDMNKLIDLQIMATCKGGKERTKDQFNDILSQSGLKLIKIHETASIFSIIEAKKC